jgi:hypothetical protein
MRVIESSPIPHPEIERYDDPDIETGLEQSGRNAAQAEYRLIELDVSEIVDSARFPLNWTPSHKIEALERGETFPPIVVVEMDRGRGFGLIDGLNRTYACWLTGTSTIRAYELLSPTSYSSGVS